MMTTFVLTLTLALSISGGQVANPDELLREARAKEASGDLDDALEGYDTFVERFPGDWRGAMLRGQLRFRLGDNRRALRDFDRVAALAPDQEPYLWQRGISQYYAGDDDACIRQFELHRTVNPNDVENAVWHFLCVARKEGVEAARSGLLPVGPDARAPMRTVYRMFAGEASPSDVLDDASRAGGAAADFYAHLYVGLYLQALGASDEALAHIRGAAESGSGVSGYMGDVARVHLAILLGASGREGGASHRSDLVPAAETADAANAICCGSPWSAGKAKASSRARAASSSSCSPLSCSASSIRGWRLRPRA